jgi:hypothetical protein
MKTRIKLGKQTRIKINENIGRPAGIRDQDIYEMQVDKNRILLEKEQTEEQ